MSIWEDQVNVADEPTVVKLRAQYDSEEDSDIKDNWDDSDSESEQEQAPAPVKPAPKVTKKPILPKELPKAEPIASEKQAQRTLIVESDIQNTEDLFSGLNIKDVEFQDAITKMNPKTEPEFNQFAQIVATKIKRMSINKNYNSFVSKLIKDIADSLPEKEIGALGRALSSLSHEKQRLAKAAAKSSKKTKASVVPLISKISYRE
ncbi:hypothetical protein BB561_001760 [Smittium simulii]|uniref:Eukaryotic translation initiation factor 3 30 kDa subunit n=1 Tax=Smittium simulii TaxID=133385 RepID=A0A2T9YTF3_9FUNG|nr:hypothetical protein BB561_001760 [Smittium simulii]